MFKNTFFPLIFMLFFSVAPVMAEKLMWFKTERIGDFSIGLSETDLKKKLSCEFERGANTLGEADGFYHQSWDCRAAGISFDMRSKSKKGNKSIASITIMAPSKLKTKRGIQIGSSEQQVIKTYNDVKDAEATIPKVEFVAGSMYGGLSFQIQNAKVTSIMLGAGAE